MIATENINGIMTLSKLEGAMRNIAVIGSSGAIGGAFVEQLSTLFPSASIYGISSKAQSEFSKNLKFSKINYDDEKSVEDAARFASHHRPLDLVIVATGILQGEDFTPEKSLRDVDAKTFAQIFNANTIFPSLAAKHFLPYLNRNEKAIFAVLSARVGSISDNQLGGWYAYRASKAALNMIIKNAAIETARRNPSAIVVGLHPGTVDSKLSKPYQRNVPEHKLFTPSFSTQMMLDVLIGLTPLQSGKCFAWDGSEIAP